MQSKMKSTLLKVIFEKIVGHFDIDFICGLDIICNANAHLNYDYDGEVKKIEV